MNEKSEGLSSLLHKTPLINVLFSLASEHIYTHELHNMIPI